MGDPISAIATTKASDAVSRRDASMTRVAILMPARDESALAATLAQIRDRARELGGVTVFLVDDGSERPIDARDLPATIADFRVVLARHVVNLGQGAALETARELALAPGAQFRAYVTMDADGQHGVDGALAVCGAIDDGANVAFGNRFLGASNVPRGRRAVLALARWFDRLVTGLRLADAHNGLRAFDRQALELVRIRQNRMAHATEIKMHVARAHGLRVVEVPVSVRYTRESLAKGQKNAGAALILRDLMMQYLFGDST